MKRAHGPWEILATHPVYRDSYIEVARDEVIRPDGKPGQHVTVAMKPGVCVLPIDQSGQITLTSEFHYAIGRDSLEGVSGGIERGESPLSTAQRELAEELGLVAQSWIPLTSLDPFTTIIRSPTQLYLARDLTSVSRALEGTERISPVHMSLDEAVEKVLSGKISHAPTCVLILWAKFVGP